MYMKTKAELIKDEKAGKLPALFVRGMSNISGLAICQASDEQVFGYHQYGETKEYFLLKINHTQTGNSYIIWKKRRLALNEFIRAGF